MISINQTPSIVLGNHVPVKTARKLGGCSPQLLLRLLRTDWLHGVKIEQLLRIDKFAIDAYLEGTEYNRYGRFVFAVGELYTI